MHENLIKQLKSLKSIQPEKEFVLGTRTLFTPIEALKPHHVISPFAWQFAGAFAVILVVVLATPFFIPRETYASLDVTSLATEMRELPISVQLKEINYRNNIEETVEDAIKEASDSEVNNLNSAILESESKKIDTETDTKTNVDNLINQALQ